VAIFKNESLVISGFRATIVLGVIFVYELAVYATHSYQRSKEAQELCQRFYEQCFMPNCFDCCHNCLTNCIKYDCEWDFEKCPF